MKLNVASGVHADLASDGWLNIDKGDPRLFPSPQDVQGDVLCMPFSDRVFEEAYCGHVLEYIEWQDLQHLGAELRRILVPSSLVMVVGPALDIAEGQGCWSPNLLRDMAEDPNRDGSGMTHAWTATVGRTWEAMDLMGLRSINRIDIESVMSPRWPNASQAGWQVAFEAKT